MPNLADLHVLYDQGFLEDEDLVRAETSERWVSAGSMPALHGVRVLRSDPKKLLPIVAAAIALAAAVALLLAR